MAYLPLTSHLLEVVSKRAEHPLFPLPVDFVYQVQCQRLCSVALLIALKHSLEFARLIGLARRQVQLQPNLHLVQWFHNLKYSLEQLSRLNL